MLFNSVYKILSNKLWAKHSVDEQRRLFHLLIIWTILGICAILLFLENLIVGNINSCLLCNSGLLLMISLGVLCIINGKSNCTINTVYSIPLFIYAYFIADFSPHLAFVDTIYISFVILTCGLIFLLFFSLTIQRVTFFYLFGVLILGFQLLKAEYLFESFNSKQEFFSNPIIIFSIFFATTYFLREKYTRKVGALNSNINATNQSITKVFQNSAFSIAKISADRDVDGNIMQLTIEKVNNAFEATFKINLYEVQEQKAEYIFSLLFKNQFDINDLIIFKKKKIKEFHSDKLDKWFKVQLLKPEYNTFYLIFEDITKVKNTISKLEENKRRYKVLLEAIPDIFFVIDKDGTYEDFVVKESHLFKIEDANIIGSTIYDVGFPPNMANKINSCIQSCIRNNSIENIEYSLDTPNGTFLYEMRLAKLSPTSVISISRNITKRKTAEFNLEKALIKAEESDRLKSAFLAHLSHEIRTPMNVITNFSRILAETDLDQNDKLEIADAITQNGKQLLNMIDNTIHLSKIETQAVDVNMQFCKINHVLRDIYNRYFTLIPDSKDVKLNLKLNVNNDDFGFKTDSRLLADTLAILVDNAVKYTLQGNIIINYEMIKNEQVKFVVSDSGIGIPEEEFENVFNRFYRLQNNINESTTGSGLGLSIAKHYVEILGGKLEFESKKHVGTSFHFSIPFKEGRGFMTLVS